MSTDPDGAGTRPVRLGLTMGDPAGIGAEIIVRTLDTGGAPGTVSVVYGDPSTIGRARELVAPDRVVRPIENPDEARPDELNVIAAAVLTGSVPAGPSAQGGRIAEACIRAAVHAALRGDVDAVVTAPISKASLRMAGFPWPGHTEMLAERTGAGSFGMMLVGGPLRVLLVTIHEPIERVPGLITRERVLASIRLAVGACRALGITAPRIGVAGLNPHAGEEGLFGREEREIIGPAVAAAAAEGLPVTGPWPPDTIFHRAFHGELDLIVAMYHDQGLIPLKMIAFESGVNVTVGLPIIRTSPDHGTAFDIAWTGRAKPDSLRAAMTLARDMVLARRKDRG